MIKEYIKKFSVIQITNQIIMRKKDLETIVKETMKKFIIEKNYKTIKTTYNELEDNILEVIMTIEVI